MQNDIERKIIELIATDRIDKPISSMSGKLKRRKPKLAKALDMEVGESFDGERVYAKVQQQERMMARGIRGGIEKFRKEYPRYAAILEGMIAEERVAREVYLYFGVKEGKRLSSEDYISVLMDLGFTEATARNLYPELIKISRDLAKKREEKERAIMLEQTLD